MADKKILLIDDENGCHSYNALTGPSPQAGYVVASWYCGLVSLLAIYTPCPAVACPNAL